jgi:hypothetical protein
VRGLYRHGGGWVFWRAGQGCVREGVAFADAAVCARIWEATLCCTQQRVGSEVTVCRLARGWCYLAIAVVGSRLRKRPEWDRHLTLVSKSPYTATLPFPTGSPRSTPTVIIRGARLFNILIQKQCAASSRRAPWRERLGCPDRLDSEAHFISR